MERIFLPRLMLLFLFWFVGTATFAQQGYFVFKKTGSPALNTSTLLERGSQLLESDTLYLGQKDYVLLVNELGELFEITKPNTYAFSAIADYRRRLEADSFTEKYFTYVWKQFINRIKKKQESGVVYREERNIKLIAPRDSVKMFAPELKFVWQNNSDTEALFFFLKDVKTGHLTKIGLTGEQIILGLDNQLLKTGQTYQWSASTESFPNLNELKFHRLTLLSKGEFEALEKEVDALIRAFTLLGFSEAEIQEAICQDYKFCQE